MRLGIGCLAALILVVAAGCSQTVTSPGGEASRCNLELTSFGDLASCRGRAKEIGLSMARPMTLGAEEHIVIASQDPLTILGAMGAFVHSRSNGDGSFEVRAYAAVADYEDYAPFNRGRIFWKTGGPITIDICLSFDRDTRGIETCASKKVIVIERSPAA